MTIFCNIKYIKCFKSICLSSIEIQIAEIGGSIHHILGDEESGYICYSENSCMNLFQDYADKDLIKNFQKKLQS